MNEFEKYLAQTGEIGFIEEVNQFLVTVGGLPSVRPEEMVIFENGTYGQVLSFGERGSEILSFSPAPLGVGTQVARTGSFLQVPVGEELLGRTLDPFGLAVDWGRPLAPPREAGRPLESAPAGISARARIRQPLETGVSLVDLILPLGQGQRELIIGDRKTGKTSFLLQVISTQAKKETICLYAAIGKRKVDIKKVEEFFRQRNLLKNIIIVAASGDQPPGVVFLAPFTAMVMAEYFRDRGRNVLLVLDDLLTHAKFYREIALLGRRFPGRDSYPGDIFYLHARLLERAGNFKTPYGEAALTCLPVVETVQSDFTGYIQSNLMAMTDGHLFFDSAVFAKGRRPAINPFLSVTRVGRQTQSALERDLSRDVIALLALYERTQNVAHFGMSLGEGIKQNLLMGERLYTFFDQPAHTIVPQTAQIVLLGLLWNGFWQEKGREEMQVELQKFQKAYESDQTLRQFLTTLLGSATSFNHWLGLLREAQPQLQKAVGRG